MFPAEIKDSTLVKWLRAVLWGSVLVPAAVFVLVAWWGYERAKAEARAGVGYAAEVVQSHALRAFSAAEEVAKRARSASLPPSGVFDEPLVHQRLSDMTAGVPSIVNLNVWGSDGGALARSDMFPVDTRASVADRDYFLEIRAGQRQIGISEVLKGRQSGKELLNLSLPRSLAPDPFSGVIAVSLSPGYFRDFYRTLSLEQVRSASYLLVRPDGKVLARWPEQEGAAASLAAPLQEQLRSQQDTAAFSWTTPTGDAHMASIRRVGSYPVHVIADVGGDAMLAGWVRFLSTLASILLPVTLLLTYVAWVALKKTRQLQVQISRRAEAERGMLEAQRLETLAILTSGVAHDFNNLLAIVSASLQVLKRQHPDLKDSKHLQAMSKAVQSGTRLTRQLLSFSKKQALRPESIALQTWLPAAESLVRSSLGARIDWALDLAPDTHPIHIDVGEFELALINLVVNARHAMPQGGKVTVKAGNASADPASRRPDASTQSAPAQGAFVCVSVADTGVGIPKDILSRVTEPFFTTREKGAGSGLGLSQVNGLCVGVGGWLEITSSPNQGTQVAMLLPASAGAPAAAAAGLDPEDKDLELSGLVLLVEDNEDVGLTTEQMLRVAGLTVVRVTDAEAALGFLRTTRHMPDVVLSDIAMPGAMNGIALAFELRRSLPRLPVVLTTGYANELNLAQAGGLRVLQKPTLPQELLAELRALIRRPPDSAAQH